jgi:hypothetical protein
MLPTGISWCPCGQCSGTCTIHDPVVEPKAGRPQA